MKSEIRAVVFDIGQVLIRLDFREVMKMRGMPPDADMQTWLRKMDDWTLYDQFERGNVSGEEFWEQTKRDFKLDFDRDEFLKRWNTVLQETISPMDEVLEGLKEKFPLFGLTNANIFHYERMLAAYPIARHFKKIYSSHELRCRKPEREIYEKVTTLIGVKAEEIFFADDRKENVNAANLFGWQAHHTPKNPDDILRLVTSLA